MLNIPNVEEAVQMKCRKFTSRELHVSSLYSLAYSLEELSVSPLVTSKADLLN